MTFDDAVSHAPKKLFFFQICDFGLARIVEPMTMQSTSEQGGGDESIDKKEDAQVSLTSPPVSVAA